MLRRGVVDHRTVRSPTFDEERRHRTGVASTICNPGSITAPRLSVQSRIEETKVEVLYEAYAVEKSLFGGEEAKIVSGKREGSVGGERSTIVSVFENDGYAAGCVGENVQDAYRQ